MHIYLIRFQIVTMNRKSIVHIGCRRSCIVLLGLLGPGAHVRDEQANAHFCVLSNARAQYILQLRNNNP